MVILDYRVMQKKIKDCKIKSLSCDYICSACDLDMKFDKISCPVCKNFMFHSTYLAVEYPELICLCCGFNKPPPVSDYLRLLGVCQGTGTKRAFSQYNRVPARLPL